MKISHFGYKSSEIATRFLPFCIHPPLEIIKKGNFMETVEAAPSKSVMIKQRFKLCSCALTNTMSLFLNALNG